jgi:hypothetical protein
MATSLAKPIANFITDIPMM